MKYIELTKKRLLKYIEYIISTYKFSEVEKFEGNLDQLSSQDPRNRTVRILKSLPAHQKKHVLLHELSHLLLFELWFAKRLFIEGEQLGIIIDHKNLDAMATRCLESIGGEDV